MKKYASTRGRKSHGRDRCTLHDSHLSAFRIWLTANSRWFELPLTAHPFEVLHVQEFDRAGDGEHQFIYRRDRNHHLTVQYRLVPWVKKWLAEKKKASTKK